MAYEERPGSDAKADRPPRPASATPSATDAEQGPAAGPGGELRATVAAVQRAAGNRAATAVAQRRLQRLKDDPKVDPVAAIGKALSDDNESQAHDLMHKLETREQANAVLERYQKRAVSCFGNDTMATAAWILVMKGGKLGRALDWMVDEGTNWKQMSSVVAAAWEDERKQVKGDAWMKWWVGRLDDGEMAELVKLLPLDLPTKLKWMKAEDSNWDLMRDVIISVPKEQRTNVVLDDSLRGFFVSNCNDAQMYEAVRLLGGPLAKQLAWMAAEDCKDSWIEERIAAVTDAKQRIAVYYDKLARDRLCEMPHAKRAELAKLLGGTPDEQLSLFQSDVPIGYLKWAAPASAAWVAAVMKYRSNPLDLLWVGSGNPASWGPLIRPHLWNLLKDFHNVIYPEFRVKVFWEAYGNGSTFNARQIMHFIGVLTGRKPVGGGKAVAGDQFWAVDPNDATARAFMEVIKPDAAGPTGAIGISRAELAKGIVAFCSHEKDKNDAWQEIQTSYFADPWIILAVTRAGARDIDPIGSDAFGTPWSVGTGLSYFANHARHEIGHAVGARKIGSMTETGNEFAKSYGGWKKSSEETFRNAMWTDVARPARGWPTVRILAANVVMTNADVRDWCMELLSKGKEKPNPIGSVAGTVQDKLAAIKGSLWSRVQLVDYLIAIGADDPTKTRDRAFKFPGFTPPDPVQIFATRWDNDFVQYTKAAHDAFQGISWYALSSPAEMFAEMYTARYAKKTLPVTVNARSPARFFATLEAQRDPLFGKP